MISADPDRQKLTQLRKLLIQHFSLDELRMLCFDLGLEYEDLPGDTLSTKMHALIEHLQRRNALFKLLEEVAEQRPTVVWPAFNNHRAPSNSAPVAKNYVEPKTGLEMIHISAGEFLYGDEKRLAYLPDYWIAKTPVTNAHYLRFVQTAGRPAPEHWQGKYPPADIAQHPVVNVTWQDAAAFAEWLGMRLPTEEEWEKAARGTEGLVYPWGNEWKDSHCNSSEAKIGGTTPVGRFSPQGDSPYGCVDMSGNVWEWTNSWRDSEKKARVLCGGSWYSSRGVARVALRYWYFPGSSDLNFGFRVVSPVVSGF
jgi:formylglycine-generating enzyme required for sulfatase activity